MHVQSDLQFYSYSLASWMIDSETVRDLILRNLKRMVVSYTFFYGIPSHTCLPVEILLKWEF